ncbi:hypothetical protein [Clostridium sp. HMP27]|uniref:hypothetical protein n=1 Tax=Clostridium sp. HMP27 TaxID=1487921 RepID=UPI000A85DC8E|nr:hypothetical protein [Clostridium sp. HMP27]
MIKLKKFFRFKSMIITLVLVSTLFSGCNTLENMKVKLGLKNTNFEYIKQNKVQKIVIQNTRDQGYRFIVTDKNVIKELYDMLSSAKEVDEKSTLQPDYIFEMHEAHDKVHKFNYVAGLDKKSGGNLYSEDKTYIVSKRIDNDIIKSFWNIRIPKDFTDIYYGSLIETLNSYIKDTKTTKKIGVNLDEDREIAKFILSTDLEDFKNKLNDKNINGELVKANPTEYDVLMTVKTQGYNRLMYKSIITFYNRQEKNTEQYYVVANYENRSWHLNATKDKPSNF